MAKRAPFVIIYFIASEVPTREEYEAIASFAPHRVLIRAAVHDPLEGGFEAANAVTGNVPKRWLTALNRKGERIYQRVENVEQANELAVELRELESERARADREWQSAQYDELKPSQVAKIAAAANQPPPPLVGTMTGLPIMPGEPVTSHTGPAFTKSPG